MDLVEDNRKISPRDYLEIALRPVQGSGGDIRAKNEVIVACAFLFSVCLFGKSFLFESLLMEVMFFVQIRDSIRALFPDRECFTLVRPLNEEKDLQRLDQISVSIVLCMLLHL